MRLKRKHNKTTSNYDECKVHELSPIKVKPDTPKEDGPPNKGQAKSAIYTPYRKITSKRGQPLYKRFHYIIACTRHSKAPCMVYDASPAGDMFQLS